MFDYSDPVGNGILAAQGALQSYRETLDSFYDFASSTPGTSYAGLDRLPANADRETIVWPAFPITAPASDIQIDNERWNFQDEYVEWRVVRNGGRIETIIFTTELPEYYEALAEVSGDALMAGIQDAIPGANPTVDELFGPNFDPNTATPQERSRRFRATTVVPFNAPAGTVPPNPWNNGKKGILCLMQRFNTMGALFNLATQCAVPNPGIPASGQCAAVCQPASCACGPQRNSDPRICTRAQEVVRIPRLVSLADPSGICVVQLNGSWRVDGSIVDINDPAANQGVWVVDRNGRRGTLDLTGNVTLNNGPVNTGTEVSRFLDVGADVVSADPNSLLAASVAAGATRSLKRTISTPLRRGE